MWRKLSETLAMPAASAVGVHGRKDKLTLWLGRPAAKFSPASRAFLCPHIQYRIAFGIRRVKTNNDQTTDKHPMQTRIINMYCSLQVTTANRNPEDRMPHTDGETTVVKPDFGDNRVLPFYPAEPDAEPDTSESWLCITVACSAPTFSRNPRLYTRNIAPFKRHIHTVKAATRRYRFQYRKRGI